ncbi:ATP-dependent zinc metalloprotease FtsH [Bdellovibrionota bacterium FG-2]
MQKKKNFSLLYLLLIFWVFLLVQDLFMTQGKSEAIPYSQFVEKLDQQKIESLVVGQERIEGTLLVAEPAKPPATVPVKKFWTLRTEDPTLIDRLTRAKVKFEAVRESTFIRAIASWVLPILVMVTIWSFFMAKAGGGGVRGQMFPLGKSKVRVYAEKDIETRFKDVAGVGEAKAELQEVVSFLKDPAHYNRLGGRMPKGLLLVGPPGTGKTLLARAVAGEAGVPFFLINGSEFVELFVGLGAARVRDLFEQARSQAPCILFIDELDALGKMRGVSAISGGANDEKEQTLNQLLAELDGFDSSKGIVLLAATNRPEVLDPALLRSGRFDRQVLIDKPDRKGRVEILNVHMQKIHLAAEINADEIASLTTGFSGADLANLVNEAALTATRRKADAVTNADFTEAIERIVAGLERKSRLLNPEEKRRVAFHEMGHVLVALAFGEGETVHKVSVIPRGMGALGYTIRRPSEDRYLACRKELEHKIAVLMGGRSSELHFLGEMSTGAADDLDKATDLARAMVTRFGMSDTLGMITYDREVSPFLNPLPSMRAFEYSEETAEGIDREVRGIVERAFSRATQIVHRFEGFVNDGVKELIVHETLNEEQIRNLWLKHRDDEIKMIA